MKQKLTLEVIAPTVEEAIEKGLEELGLEANEVDVEVLDEGKRNIFRFAARQARVRLTVKESVMAGAEPAKEDPLEEEEYELDPKKLSMRTIFSNRKSTKSKSLAPRLRICRISAVKKKRFC